MVSELLTKWAQFALLEIIPRHVLMKNLEEVNERFLSIQDECQEAKIAAESEEQNIFAYEEHHTLPPELRACLIAAPVLVPLGVYMGAVLPKQIGSWATAINDTAHDLSSRVKMKAQQGYHQIYDNFKQQNYHQICDAVKTNTLEILHSLQNKTNECDKSYHRFSKKMIYAFLGIENQFDETQHDQGSVKHKKKHTKNHHKRNK